MLRGVLGFTYEEEKHATGMTGLAGLPVYLDLPHMMGLPEQIGRHLQVKQRGWTDARMVLALMLRVSPLSRQKNGLYMVHGVSLHGFRV